MSSECRSCGQEIVWAYHHRTENAMPLEGATKEQIDNGKGLWRVKEEGERTVAYPAKTEDAYGMFPVKLYISHFATCEDAENWRGGGDG